MASHSSSDHPESSHPYHADRSCSTTSLESQSKKRLGGLLARLLLKSRREGLLPLPEGASLSSSSPPQLLPLTPLQSIHLPHPASTDTTGITVGDSTWAATYKSLPLPPTTILGMPILQHPQPQSAQASSGTILPFHSAPTSQHPAMAHLSTEHLAHQQVPSSIEELRQSGISPYRPMSAHSSLYRQSRNPSRIDRQLRSEPQPPPELLAPPELRYYEYFTDKTTGEGTLQELPPRPDTPFPSIPDEEANSESTPEPPQSVANRP